MKCFVIHKPKFNVLFVNRINFELSDHVNIWVILHK